MKQKVMVIGLDGGTWSLLDPLMDMGVMPNLASLCRSGYRSELTSTIPAITPTAWSSFATGVNPGKHGVFGFFAPQLAPGQYFPPLARRDILGRPTLRRLLSKQGLKTTMLGVPMTWPPEHVNGTLVTGMFTPGIQADCTWPPELKQELMDNDCMPDLDVCLYDESHKKQESGEIDDQQHYQSFFDDLSRYNQKLLGAGLYLLRRPWDFFMTVFISTDRIQHALYHKIAALTPDDHSYLAGRIRQFYREIDEAIGRLLAAAGENCTCLFMSDHGFGPFDGYYYLGRHLQKNNYARLRRRPVYDLAKKLIRHTGLKRFLVKKLSRDSMAKVISQGMPCDWKKTRVYMNSGIQINLQGRELYGIVPPHEYDSLRSELRNMLLSIESPGGGRIFKNVWFPEEIYHGDYVQWARDLILEPADEPCHEFFFGDPSSPELVSHSPTATGTHRSNGIFLAHGPHVLESNTAMPAHIMDLAPTILWLLNQPVPNDMDGRIIETAFESANLPAPRYVEMHPDAASPSEKNIIPLDNITEEQKIIKDRLKQIGYLE